MTQNASVVKAGAVVVNNHYEPVVAALSAIINTKTIGQLHRIVHAGGKMPR